MDFIGQTSLLVALVSIAVGLSVLSRNIRNKVFIAFSTLCILISAWAFSFFLFKIFGNPSFYRAHLLANVWLGPAAILFTRRIIGITDAFSNRLYDFALLLGLGLSVSLGFHYEDIHWIQELTLFTPVTILIHTLYLMWNERNVKIRLKGKKPVFRVHFGRRSYIYLGALLALCFCTLDHIRTIPMLIPSFGNMFLMVYLFFLSQVVSQQRLLNFGAILSRFLVLLIVAFTLTAVYSLIFAWIENRLALFFLNSFFVSFLLLMVLDPLRSFVQFLTHRFLTQKYRRMQTTVQNAIRQMVSVVSPEALYQLVLITIDQTIQPDRTSLFILKGDGTKFLRVRSSGSKSGEKSLKEILVDHPLLKHCEKLQRKGELPVILDQIVEGEIEVSVSRTEKRALEAIIQALKAIDANLLIPLIFDTKILGFVCLKVYHLPEPWGNNWGILHVLYPYFEMAAQTLQNMEVFVRQREKERLAELGEMAAGLAHEIRNPLGAIKGAAQFLDTNTERPEKRFLQIIVEEVDRLNRVVSQFLDFSKPFNIEFEETNLDLIARKTIELLRSNLPPSIELSYVPPEENALILGAPVQIQQILLNLIQNAMHALKSISQGRILVQVHNTQSTENPSNVLITVEDNGPGIKRELMDKIFIPFFTTSPEGTGLGLPICQKIAEAHRGRIEVASEEGRFTRFTVSFPAFASKDMGTSPAALTNSNSRTTLLPEASSWRS